ncbi:MAG: hypothetical protein U0031_06425 [Thermomicrobiales bacterium]
MTRLDAQWLSGLGGTSNRRAMLTAYGVAVLGGVASAVRAGAVPRRLNAHIAYVSWFDYTDRDGASLAKILPIGLIDQTFVDGSTTPIGERDLALRLLIQTNVDRPLVISPDSFALWDLEGFLYRPLPHDAPFPPLECDAEVCPPAQVFPDPEMGDLDRMWRIRDEQYLTDAPLTPASRVFRRILFRVPQAAELIRIVFTPEPDRLLILADFTPTNVIFN